MDSKPAYNNNLNDCLWIPDKSKSTNMDKFRNHVNEKYELQIGGSYCYIFSYFN